MKSIKSNVKVFQHSSIQVFKSLLQDQLFVQCSGGDHQDEGLVPGPQSSSYHYQYQYSSEHPQN